MSRVFPLLSALALLSAATPALAQRADIATTITGPESVTRSETITWIGTVENRGPDAATDVIVNMGDYFSPCYDLLNIGTLAAGEKRTFTCSGNADVGMPIYTRSASMFARSEHVFDVNYENNSSWWNVRVITPPDLFTFTNDAPLAAPKHPFTIDVVYGNRAHTPATGVTVTLTAPSRFLEVPDFCTADGNRAVCSLGTVEQVLLPQPGPKTFRVRIEAPDESGVPIELGMSIAGNEAEEEPEDNQYTRVGRVYRTFFVRNTADHGSDSLRAAIETATASCGDGYPCLVAFRIPPGAAASHEIALESPLPRVVGRSVLVDANTQQFYFEGTAKPSIHGHALREGNGLELALGCDGGIRGLGIYDFPASGVLVTSDLPCEVYWGRGRAIQGSVIERNGRGIWIAAANWSIHDNWINYNTRAGVFLERGLTLLMRNTIRENGASGVFVSAAASGTDLTHNTITGNAHFGIAVDPTADKVSARMNAIANNTNHGIDWGLDGAATAAPIPIPELTSVRFEDGVTIVEGFSDAYGTFAPNVDIYANTAPDPSGYGEGERYLGTINDIRNGRFTFRYAGDLRGQWITATATRNTYIGWLRKEPVASNGDTGWGYFTTTSEFSRAVEVK